MRMPVLTIISLASLFLTPVGSIASPYTPTKPPPGERIKPPRDAVELTKRMNEIIDHIDSIEYAEAVS